MTKVYPYTPATWFTVLGAWKLRKQYEKRGIPDIRNWRFVTLTLAQANYPDAETAFDDGNDRFRHFFEEVRKRYGKFRWFKKLEFHKSGHAHWHVLMSITTPVDLDFFRKAWGKGRVEVQRVRKSGVGKVLDYCFKYAIKAVDAPDWILDRCRIRIAESRNFFACPARAVPPASQDENQEETEKIDDPLKQTESIRERLKKWAGQVLLDRGHDIHGRRIIRREMLSDGCTFADLIQLTVKQMLSRPERAKRFQLTPWEISLPESFLDKWGAIYQPTV